MDKLIKIDEVTKEELLEIENHNKNAMRLHIPVMPVTFLKLDVHSKIGEHLVEYNTRAKSWNRNAYNMLFSGMTGLLSNSGGTSFGAGKMPLKGENGTTYQGATYVDTIFSAYASSCIGALGVETGIVVGTGIGAEDFEGYMLTTKVANGTTSGKLSHTAQNTTTLAYDVGTKKYTATALRIFNNNSGGLITITETGLLWYLQSGGLIMVDRTLLGVGVAVADTAQLTVTYTIELIYPA
jgi:hypothetical protein